MPEQAGHAPSEIDGSAGGAAGGAADMAPGGVADGAGDRSACAAAGGGTSLPDELRTWMRMLAAAGVVEQTMSKHVKRAFGVSHDEFLVLCLLADQPGSTARMTQVAELLGRPKTRLTYQVAFLQHAGLVTRESVRGDRRGIALTLTEKARRLLAEQGPALAAAVRQALEETVRCERGRALAALMPAEEFGGVAGADVASGSDG